MKLVFKLNKIRHLYFTGLIILLFTVDGYSQEIDWNEKEISVDGVPVVVEIADTSYKKSIGLQNRDSLEDNQGMLFVYKKPRFLQFWMKDTSIPLDLAYIDEEGKILQIIQLVPFDETAQPSDEKVKCALEMNQGWFDENGVSVGDYIDGI